MGLEGLLLDLLKVAGGVLVGVAVRDLAGRGKPGVKSGKVGKPTGKKKSTTAVRVSVPRPTEELKMILCVNQGLKMGTGKVGAQCAHAAVGVIQQHLSRHEVAFRQWEMHGQPKIAVKVQDDQEMAALEDKAAALGIPTYIVHDAGRTQIAAGSQTVLAIGPAPKSKIDQVTGHLRLL